MNAIEKFKVLLSSIGVSMSIWKNPATGKLDWTSLVGDPKKKLFRVLPNHMEAILPTTAAEKTKILWKVSIVLNITFSFQP